MGFRGQNFAFDSPSAAVAAMIDRIRALNTPTCADVERVALRDALGRVLASDISCDRDSPAFDYSAMDGYAVRAPDVARAARARGPGATLPIAVTGESRIGLPPPMLGPFSGALGAIRIATGAPIPSGATAVIKREDVAEDADGRNIHLTVQHPLKLADGDHVRQRGENARAGDIVLGAGCILTPAAIGTLAAVGCHSPPVRPRVRVCLIATGDELAPSGALPAQFQIRDSNTPALAALLHARPWINLAPPVHVLDNQDGLGVALARALAECDAVILTGGVSMGHRDPVRAAVEHLRGTILFHGLPQRPGKPILGATLEHPVGVKIIFGLPGNPVSAMVTAVRIALPVLSVLAGASAAPGHVPASLGPRLVTLTNSDGRSIDQWWHRVALLQPGAHATLLDIRGSGDVIAAGRSDGFVEIAPAALADSPTPTSGLVHFYSWC